MNKESLKEYLSSKYQGWSSFLSNVIFPIFGEDDFEDGYEAELLESQPEHKQLAEATGIRSIKQVGMMYVGVEPLQIFDVTVSDRVMMERNRVNIQRLIRAVMDQFSCAFMLFHYEDDSRWDWRFTYCRKSGNKEESTDSKRYTFLLGPGQSCRTATDNFMALYEKRESLEIKDIEDAFNVEALSKEFFGKYKTQYEAFVNYMVDPANGMRQDFIDTDFDHTGMSADKIRDREEKPIRDYVKKLLGRIVFLHFLQKKGWLGVPAGTEWGEGDRDFMLKLFQNATDKQKNNFLDDILEDLFAEGLDRNRSDKGDLYDTEVSGIGKCRIPYLNGGLFERDELDKKPSHFPAEYFDNLLTMLSQYNFTIDENDPNDAEVGVDPEMLGRIFENLLEDNKDKGAFYTPKEIVQYMCRESLIAYLQTDQRDEDKERIRQFVTTHDAEMLGELKEDIDQKLIDVKICDPAIGSGAFPMGLLRELFFCRSAIEPNIVENAANIKRHIIQNNIYGVDIERGAVDIARLRFWLSLIVDEKSPEALPNLDFKIMQGNSLLEQYKGADLSTMTEKKVGAGQGITIFDSMLDVYRKNLRDKLTEYYACPEHDKKVQLRKDIADIVKKELYEQGINIDFGDIDMSANNQFFLWHTWFHDVFSRPSKEGFDIVIGNPPYVKEYVNRHAFDGFRETSPYYMGKMDLWYGFACHGIDLLCQSGHLCFIAQNNWTTSAGAKKMRNKIVADARILQMLDFNTFMAFESADIQTMIMLFEKNQTTDNYGLDYRTLMEGATKEDMLALLNKQIRRTIYRMQKFSRTKYANKLFTFSDNELIFDKIAENKTYLQNDEATNGIHTHHDCVNNKIHGQFPDLEVGKGIFVLSSEEKESLNLTTVEKSLIKPFFTSDEIFRFYTSNNNKSWIIYTDSQYKDIHSMDQYPHIKKHLDIVGKAITSDNKPYGLHRARERRFFVGEKIVSLRKCVERPCFSFSDFDCYVPAMYYVIKTSRWNMKFLTGILNSKLIAFWLRHKGKMQGSNYQVDKEPLQGIPLPLVDLSLQQPIIALVDIILAKKKLNPLADTSVLERKIDRLTYNLYGLSEDDIKIVEGI